uniref:Dopey_N domain-containing protein n=1 Tax=Angiostrongylus cantonensis TaxID=6313 RepID=A0A158P6E2_ANGCA
MDRDRKLLATNRGITSTQRNRLLKLSHLSRTWAKHGDDESSGDRRLGTYTQIVPASMLGDCQVSHMSLSSAGFSLGDVTTPNPLHNTSKYKVYVQAVDRALKTFENPNEWADLISALAKLTKVFQSNAKFGDIPKPVTVAKRLSQCLHPALPMGVHLKALETYRQIFDILGPQSLPKLLYLFAVGLFPLMDHCGIKYLLPLGQNLRPALPGFLAGVLLGLEEGTEFYERSLSVLDQVCEGVGERAFFACLWQAVLDSPSVRLPAMLYVNAKFDKTRTLDDQIAIVGDHVNHMVAALCATANDSGSPLVQRNLLDFLCSAFPLDSTNLTREDFVQLIMRCMFVVLRRDMSLNRRLYTWLMNPTALPLIVDALTEYLKLDIVEIPQSSTNAWAYGWGDKRESEQHQFAEVRVCRLLLYLQDRTDIGAPVLNSVFPLFLICVSNIYERLTKDFFHVEESKHVKSNMERNHLRLSLDLKKNPSCLLYAGLEVDKTNDEKRRLDEISKTFNLLLNSLEQGFLFEFLGSWFTKLLDTVEPNSNDISQFSKDSPRKQARHALVSGVIDEGLIISSTLWNIHFLFPSSFLRSTETFRIVLLLDQVLMESCLMECLTLLSSVSSIYCTTRSSVHLPLFTAVCSLTSQFVDYPLYCVTIEHQSSPQLPNWLYEILKVHYVQIPKFDVYMYSLMIFHVIDADTWVQLMSSTSSGVDASDLSARITAFDLLLSIYLKCSSVLSQHDAISGRLAEGHESYILSNVPPCRNDEVLLTTVLLKPLLFTAQLNQLEKERVFEVHLLFISVIKRRCGQAIWLAVGSLRCAEEHEKLSRLMALLHSRKSNEPSSDMENIVVSALTSADTVCVYVENKAYSYREELIAKITRPSTCIHILTISTQAAQTFHRMWMLTRAAVMLLLGVLADESVSRDRTELKSAAAAWFIDCAKHNDLPRIVQVGDACDDANEPCNSSDLDPVCLAGGEEFFSLRLSKDQFSSMPPDVAVVTLVTHDGKQRLYHFDGPVPTDGFKELESDTSFSTWLYELRNRLLLSSETGASEAEPGALSTCAAVVGGDIPNFDEDTVRGSIYRTKRISTSSTYLFILKDSLDTLSISMEGVDVTVMETMQFMIECIVEEEESELDNRQRLESALISAPPEGSTVVFRSDCESEVEPSAVSSRSTHESSEQSAAFVSDGVPSSYKFKKGHRRQDSLQESIFSMTERELNYYEVSILSSRTFDTTELLRASIESASEGVSLFHESHVHMLLYGESGRVVDLGRSETAFRILTALLCPRGSPVSNRMLLSCLVSSGTAAQNGDNSCASSLLTVSLVDLMAKHVRAILGQHFWSVTGDEDISKHRHLTLLELLITISLHFLRSFFLNSPICPVTQSDLVMAWKCKIAALDFLSELLGELCEMICEQQSRPFAMFVQSVISRSKLQRCLLHLLLTVVHDPRTSADSGQAMPLSVSIFEFNEGRSSSTGRHLAGLLSAYNRSLLSVTAQAIRLESSIKNAYSTFGDINPSCVVNRLVAQQIYNTPPHRGTLREPSPALVELRAFLLIVLSALKTNPERHEMWFQFVVQILPWMERSLATVMVRVVEQLCKNVETALSICFSDVVDSEVAIGSKEFEQNYPACFITMTLETITTLVHFCVVDTAAAGPTIHPGAPIVTGNSAGSMVGQAMAVIPGTKGATELFSNLVKVFSFSDSTSKCFYFCCNKSIQTGGANLAKLEGTRGSVALRQARNDMLTSLPHALATICDVWTVVRSNSTPCLPLGSPQHFRRLVLDLLSPIAQHHQQAFLTALSLVWLTRSGNGATSQRKMDPDRLNFHYTPAQHDISNLLLSIKVISFEELLSAVSDTLKEVGVKATKLGVGEKLRSCWSYFHSLFCDAPLSSLPPRAIFLLYIILCDYVRCAGASYIVEDKNMSRAIQDTVQRLTEAVNIIVGWQLETTTWLKRTLDASPSIEVNTPLNTPFPSMIQPSSLDTGSLPEKKSSSNLRGSVKDTNNNRRDPAHSTQALFLLAENLAELVDSVCKSDDKERLLPTLQAVWGNVVPYLRAKNARNSRFFLASSQLLASMSSFSYMRPIWKKTTLELLLDSSFFKMDMQSLKQWLIVSDHLMTHDKTSFKDLLKSIAYTPNASFSIMTSKEQEYEARALAVKRLAFVVLERLSENLRVSQSPSIRSAVFLCIRVLLLRLRPPSLIGIWPIMITELVHVLLQMEQQLCSEGNGIEDLGCARDDAWMQLYLAACKTLETLCTLPAGYLAQFQMCHWAFVNSVSTSKTDMFLPFAGRINKLLRTKGGSSFLAGSLSYKSAVQRLEHALCVDFAEHWQL